VIRLISLYLLLAATFISLPLSPLSAQVADEDQEVFLTFRYQNLISEYIIAYYRDGEFFLPQHELFSALSLESNIDPAANRISGQFMELGEYAIDLERLTATLANREIELTADDFILTELDIFLHPDIFRDLFELDFYVDFNNLRLQLTSAQTLPVETRRDRERQRQRALRTQPDPFGDFYDLRYDRNRQIFNAGFLDYNFSANISEGNNSYLYNTGIGMEVLGGDLQGNIFGNWSHQASSLRSNNLRWRYALEDRNWLTQITTGQTVSHGLLQSAYSGIQLTNEPIEPRFLFDDYAFTGTTAPESEVELYRNNVLIDYQRADEFGNYRFQVPLTYGTSQFDVRTYSPTGQVSQQLTRMQVPFSFVPPGEINYSIDAGRLDNPIPGTTDRGLLAKGHVRTGISNRLSAQGGVEYYEFFHDNGLPTFSTSLTGRISTNYLVTVEAASQAFYRVNAGVIYPSSASFDINYTHFTRQGGVYNPGRNLNNLRVNIFTPFEIGNLPFFFRATMNRDEREMTEIYRYNLNMSTRINRFNFRLGYRDTQLGRFSAQTTPLARLNATTTYTVPRSRNMPNILRGTLLRVRTNYATGMNQFEDIEFQASRSILQRGRLQLTAGRNFLGDFNYASASLSIDFDSFRSNSIARSTRDRSSLTQSVRGSVGYDSGNQRVVTGNRQQVGRSAVAVRMFVDNNNSGEFNDGDELIEETAIRIERAGSAVRTEKGITYLSQLQPYRQYNMTVNKSAIRNPLLVPLVESFSFVTDPNQYKILDIPLYMSGVIEGQVLREAGDAAMGVAGLRLILEQTDNPEGTDPYRAEFRTFSDGSFYAYEVHPGKYQLQVDPAQLELLNAVAEPGILEFEIEASSEGDYIDDLIIIIRPPPLTVDDPPPLPETEDLPTPPERDDRIIREAPACRYSIQFGSYRDMDYTIGQAELALDEFDESITIYFNKNTDLYAMKTDPVETLSEAIEKLNRFSSIASHHQYAILSNCSDPSQVNEIVPLRFLVTLIAYRSLEDAENFKYAMLEQFNLDLQIMHLEDRDLYRVYAGPFSNKRDADQYLDELMEMELPVEPTSFRDPATLRPVSLSFQLQTDHSLEAGEWADQLDLCNERTGSDCQLIEGRNGEIHILVDREFRSWSSFTGFYSRMQSLYEGEPLIIRIKIQ